MSSRPIPQIFRNEKGAIDLASIMVGIIVIGMIGGVIAATVFAVIPWTQDKAAKQQLDSVSMAQAAYKARSSDADAESAGYTPNSYGTSERLDTASLLTKGDTYCSAPRGDGYVAFSRSSSGKNFTITDKNTSPVAYDVATVEDASLPGCEFLKDILPAPTSPSSAITILTYKCDTISTDSMPFVANVTGRLATEGSNGAKTDSNYTNASATDKLTFIAGVTYRVIFEGTYSSFTQSSAGNNLSSCLRSVDRWDEEIGATSAAHAFFWSINLTNVPKNIPSTITNVNSMFFEANVFNQDISSWDTSNITNMSKMFFNATVFNQPLNTWKISNVTDMSDMFYDATMFNQDVSSWDTSRVTNMKSVFSNAPAFNQPLNTWNTSKVTNMNNMFYGATSFNQPLDKWNTSKVINLNGTFHLASSFNRDLSMWKFDVRPSRTDFNTLSGLNDAYLPKW